MKYVLGFIFCLEKRQVLLIRKNKPAFQKGFHNGIGGKVEPNEYPRAAMVRECEEECGLVTSEKEWRLFCEMDCQESTDGITPTWHIDCFVYNVTYERFKNLISTTDEVITIWSLMHIHTMNKTLLGNTAWLIGMALDKLLNDSFASPTINYHGLSLPLNLKKWKK